MKKKEYKAFTLIELLVVISVIAMLTAIVMPSLRKAKAIAKRTVCLSNVRQLVLGATVYQLDFKGKFPHQYADLSKFQDGYYHYMACNAFTDTNHTDNWVNNIYPYVETKEMFLCPANKKLVTSDPLFAPNKDNQISYSANGVLTHLGGAKIRRTPSELVAITDDVGVSNAAMVRPFFLKNDDSGIRTEKGWTGWMRADVGQLFADQPHKSGRAYGYLDGHSAYADWEDVTSLSFGLLIGFDGEDGHEPEDVKSYGDPRRKGFIVR